MSLLRSVFRLRTDEASTSHEIKAPETHRVVRDPTIRDPKVLTPEEEKDMPHRIFIYNRQKAYLCRIMNPSLMDAPSHKRTNREPNRNVLPFVEADQNHAAWAFRWDFSEWKKEYNITTIVIWELAQFVDEDTSDIVFAPSQEEMRQRHQYQNGQLTPPNGDDAAKAAEEEKKAREMQAYYARNVWNPNRKPLEQLETLNEETEVQMKEQSGGRLERLASRLKILDFDTLHLRDNATCINRHTIMLFYFIKLLGKQVRNLNLDCIRAEKRISLVDNLNLHQLDSIMVTQADHHAAFYEDSITDVMFEWLKIPVEKKRVMNFYFKNVNQWHCTTKPHIFGQIVFDEGIFDVLHLVQCLEREWPCYWNPKKNSMRFRDINSYVIPHRKKEFVFPHRYSDAIIHYSYREGQCVFRCFPNQGLMLKAVLPARTWRNFIASEGAFQYDAPSPHQDMIFMQLKPMESKNSGGLFTRIVDMIAFM